MLQPRRRSDADRLWFIQARQIRLFTTLFTVDETLAFTHALDNRGALLAMTVRADYRWKARHFNVALIQKVLKQFLKLRAPEGGQLVAVIQDHLELTLTIFN